MRVDAPEPDWIGLAILVEEGWLGVAPKRLAAGIADPAGAGQAPAGAPRVTTDANGRPGGPRDA